MIKELAEAPKSQNPSITEAFSFVFIDANSHVGSLQECEASIRDGDVNHTPQGEALIEILKKHNAKIVHGRMCSMGATYAPLSKKSGNTIIDYVITENLNSISSAGFCPQGEIGSDHNGLYIRVKCDHKILSKCHRSQKKKKTKETVAQSSCPYSRYDLQDKSEELIKTIANLTTASQAIGKLNHSNSVDSNWETLREIMLKAATKVAPKKKNTGVPRPLNWKPFWNIETDLLRKARILISRELSWAIKKGKPTLEISERLLQATKKSKISARQARAKYYDKKDLEWQKLASDPKTSDKFWKHLKKDSSLPGNDNSSKISLDTNIAGIKTNGPREACELFRDQYEIIGGDHPPQGHSFDMQERTRQQLQVKQILSLPKYSGPIDHPISMKEISFAIRRLKFKKASGPDQISTEILKIAEEAIAPSLLLIFNQCLEHGACPEQWQTAVVTCLHKGKRLPKSDWRNYRLISLLSVVAKVFESINSTRITTLLNENNLLFRGQGGFRGKGRSCAHHSWSLSEIIKNRGREGKLTFIAFLDVKKHTPQFSELPFWNDSTK